MILKYFRAIVDGFFWSAAIYFSANESYKLAFFLVSVSEKLTLRLDEENCLLKGFLLAVLGRDAESYKYISLSIDYIDVSNDLNVDERNYLKNYSVNLIKKLRLNDKLIPTFDLYDKGNVSEHLRKNFPVN